MPDLSTQSDLLGFIVDRVEVGVVVIDKDMSIRLWNRFMEHHSGHMAEAILGQNLFDAFPELPRSWLERKIKNVYILKNFAFTSWKQRPYLFRFPHNRPVTGGVDCMRQNCTFLPILNDAGEVDQICITLFDATDESISEDRLQEARDKLAESSIRDPLTGIYNRRHLEAVLSKEFLRAGRHQLNLCVLLLDLDHFKKVNDTYGHLAGDEVLKETAARISKSLRETDTLARYGGEEFALVLPETDVEGALVVAERVRSVIADTPVIFENISLPVSTSIGLSEFTSDLAKYSHLIDTADTALYQSKKNGRNRVTVYSPGIAEDPHKK